MRDTGYGNLWADFITLIESHDMFPFVRIHTSTWDDKNSVSRELGVWVNTARGIMLIADSIHGRLNGGNLYCFVKTPTSRWPHAHASGGFVDQDSNIMYLNKDVRSNLLRWLSLLYGEVEPVVPWPQEQFVWHRGENQKQMECKDFDAIFQGVDKDIRDIFIRQRSYISFQQRAVIKKQWEGVRDE